MRRPARVGPRAGRRRGAAAIALAGALLALMPTPPPACARTGGAEAPALGADRHAQLLEQQAALDELALRYRRLLRGALITGGALLVTLVVVGWNLLLIRRRTASQMMHQTHAERLLRRELEHRVRNNLSSLISLIDLSRADTPADSDPLDAIRGRIATMATVHAMLSRAKWRPIDLRRLVMSILEPAQERRVEVEGPDVIVPVAQAQALAIVVNELAVNSRKYGSLGTSDGSVRISVDLGEDGPGVRARLVWEERGGPPIEGPVERGVGSELIEGLVRSELRGEVEFTYAREGARHTILLTLDDGAAHHFDALRPSSVAPDVHR